MCSDAALLDICIAAEMLKHGLYSIVPAGGFRASAQAVASNVSDAGLQVAGAQPSFHEAGSSGERDSH